MAVPKPKRIPIKIDMTPMVDIAFLLLVFFMSTTQFKPPEEFPVSLPGSHSEIKLPESDIVIITIPKQNKVYLTTGAANLDLNLGQLKATELKLDVDAGNCRSNLPSSAGNTQVSLKANAANVELTIPKGVAARIEADTNLSALEVDESRFPKNGGYYISQGFEGSENKIYLRVNCNIGRVKIE